MYYTMQCGCECEAYVSIGWDCECCGTEYEIDDAYIVTPCSTHGG